MNSWQTYSRGGQMQREPRAKKDNKSKSTKRVEDKKVWADSWWKIVQGRLVPSRGRPKKTSSVFKFVAEKLPFASLDSVRKHITELRKQRKSKKQDDKRRLNGVYLAHDSMGFARYGGRGQIFNRLLAHAKRYPRELAYFSFYVVAEKQHEREIETVILRAAGPQLLLNQRKVQSDIRAGNVGDYESGSYFYQRQSLRGKRSKKAVTE
jgi:hypothetical protein